MNSYESLELTTICEFTENDVGQQRFSTVTQAESGAENKEAAGSRNHWPQWRQIPDNVVETSSPSGDSGDGSGLPTRVERGSRSV